MVAVGVTGAVPLPSDLFGGRTFVARGERNVESYIDPLPVCEIGKRRCESGG